MYTEAGHFGRIVRESESYLQWLRMNRMEPNNPVKRSIHTDRTQGNTS